MPERQDPRSRTAGGRRCTSRCSAPDLESISISLPILLLPFHLCLCYVFSNPETYIAVAALPCYRRDSNTGRPGLGCLVFRVPSPQCVHPCMDVPYALCDGMSVPPPYLGISLTLPHDQGRGTKQPTIQRPRTKHEAPCTKGTKKREFFPSLAVRPPGGTPPRKGTPALPVRNQPNPAVARARRSVRFCTVGTAPGPWREDNSTGVLSAGISAAYYQGQDKYNNTCSMPRSALTRGLPSSSPMGSGTPSHYQHTGVKGRGQERGERLTVARPVAAGRLSNGGRGGQARRALARTLTTLLSERDTPELSVRRKER